MKRPRLTLIAFFIAVSGCLAPQPIAAQARDWTQVPIPPLSAFHPQEPKLIEPPTGMIIPLP